MPERLETASRQRVLAFLAACAGASACGLLGGDRAPELHDGSHDGSRAGHVAPDAPAGPLLVTGGAIYLGAPDWRAVEALWIEDGRVVACGSASEVRAGHGAPAATIDLDGAVALPGLQDAHGHLAGYGEALATLDLRGCASYAELVDRAAARAAELAPGQWLLGRGWDQNLWPEREFPHHAGLSERVPEHPVLLERVDGHAVLVNRAALALAGLDREFASDTPVPGGRVLLDAARHPTGVFIDTAAAELAKLVPAPDAATRAARILAAQEALLGAGLTCVHDMGTSLADLEVLETLRAEGRLALRVVSYLDASALREPDVAALVPATDAGDLLCVRGVKLYADGALGSRGAALLWDYADDPGNIGLLQATPDELAADLARCAELALQPAVHAIGDRANRLVLDLFERAAAERPGFAALRPRVEHVQVIAPADAARFAALGAVPSMQPTHATSDMPWAEARLGPERLERAYAWRAVGSPDSPLAFGSDFPVESPRPLLGVYAAITRQDAAGSPPGGWLPEHRLDTAEALAAFSAGAAFAARQESERGTLAAGAWADLTVIDVDPFDAAPPELLRANVRMTIVNGRVAWRAPGS
jgi:predicted amidohydrolase YtcJ